MAQTQDILSYRGHDLIGSDGEKLGTIEEIYIDRTSEQPEWALITTGLFGTKRSFVPIQQASADDEDLRVPFDKATVKDAPKIDPDGELSEDEESQLYQHYGLAYDDDTRAPTGLSEDGAPGTGGTAQRDDATGGRSDAVGRDVSGPTTDHAMTRSEEELRVGTTEREAGRVRLRKYVVEDEVTQTVPVRREEVRVEREPITDANRDDAMDGPAISEEEHEVVLREEEPVVEKRAVPKERVRLGKDVEMGEETVSDTVRKEEIDVDDPRGVN